MAGCVLLSVRVKMTTDSRQANAKYGNNEAGILVIMIIFRDTKMNQVSHVYQLFLLFWSINSICPCWPKALPDLILSYVVVMEVVRMVIKQYNGSIIF